MLIEIFKTSVTDEHLAMLIAEEIRRSFGEVKATFDLEDCDKILRIEAADIQANEIICLLHRCGFECEILE